MSRKVVIPLTVLALLCASTAAYGVADAYDVVPGILTLKPSDPRLALPKVHVARTDDGVAPAKLLDANAPMPDKNAVQGQLDDFVAAMNDGKGDAKVGLSLLVVDTATGETLGSYDDRLLTVPASNNKLFTAVTALETLGPDFRFTTKCVLQGDTLFLVAGGDQLLARDAGGHRGADGYAGVGDLAAQCAARLKAQGVKQVKVRLDDSIYSSQRVNPHWIDEDVANRAAPISAAAFEVGYTNAIRDAAVADPAMVVAQVFGEHLGKDGVSVQGDVVRGQAPKDAKPLAQVQSAPVSEVIDLMMSRSDNSLAEGLCWASAAHKDKQGSFENGVALVHETVAHFGVDADQFKSVDCSGLSAQDHTTARALVDVLQAAASVKNPKLQSLVYMLPVSGLYGTLSQRLYRDGMAGHVRMKTGSLGVVHSLSGYVLTRSGRLLTVSMLVYSDDPQVLARGYEQMDRRVSNIAAM